VVSRDRFIQIFLEEGLDTEWAEICWNRYEHARPKMPEEYAAKYAAKSDTGSEGEESLVRKIAKCWVKYGEEGGL